MIRNKFKWIADLNLEELRNALYEALTEADDLKKRLISGEQKDSVKLVRNSSGVNVEVKVYNNNVKKAAKDAEIELNRLNEKYNGK